MSTAPSIARDALGLGLRRAHYGYLFEHWPAVDYFEVISENFMTGALPPRRRLDAVRARYPVVLHGVGLNLLGHAPLDERYLDALCRLADDVDAPFVTDHLCWTGDHNRSHHDLLPTPYVRDLVGYAAERAAYVQRRLGRRFGLENLSSYVGFRASTMPEWDFYAAVVRESDCWFMLDVNNVYVSSQNHGFDPHEYLAAIDFSRVLQVHLAGHAREPDGTLVDTHDHPVCDPVWQLYADAWRRGGPFPTLLEWDERIPPMPAVLAELAKARVVRAAPREAPAWLGALQQRFGDTIRTPLDRSTGSLRAAVERYAAEALGDAHDGPRASASERLAVYNRQYWFRLFTALQTAFPLTARLLGHWAFNDHAARFLSSRAPSTWDLDRAPDGFESFLERSLDERDPTREALLDAARIDAAWHRIFRAPETSPYAPTSNDAPRLLDARLERSPAVAIVRERWALVAARRALLAAPGERAVPVPAAHPAPRWWHLSRAEGGITAHPLAELEGELLTRLGETTVGEALAQLEQACSEQERALLPTHAQRWLAASVARGDWVGLAYDALTEE